MNVVIRDIGNSKGIILPNYALKVVGIGKMADMQVKKDCIVLKAANHPRADWLEAIHLDPPADYEPVFLDGIDDADTMEEWQW